MQLFPRHDAARRGPTARGQPVRQHLGIKSQIDEARRFGDDAATRGLPASVWRPEASEDFSLLTRNGLHAPAFADWLRAERLEALGLVDPARLARTYAAWREGRAPADLDANLIAVAVLEATLAALE